MKLAKMAGIRKPLHEGLPVKLYRVMKLTTLLLLAGFLEVQAHGYAQERITLSEKDALFARIFQAIEKQTDYHFFYDYTILPPAAKVSIEVKNASIEQVLELCFKDQPLSYSIVGKLIVIKEKPDPRKKERISNYGTGPPDVVVGTVRNEEGQPLAGATIEIRKLNIKGIANEKGEFSLKGVPNGKYEVDVSFVGYERYHTDIIVDNNRILLTVNLKHGTGSLDEVQIIAYGTTTRRFDLGGVSSVKAAEIEEQPVSNSLLALEGRVPGLFVTQTSGVSGSAVTVQIRGQNSIANGNDPFYVIDGVPYSSQLLTNMGSIFGSSNNGNSSGNPLSFINPSDILRIDILKDADATAIYGSRAANGAILITTKKGASGKTELDLNLQTGWGAVTRKIGLMNTAEYLQMRHEAIANDGLTTQSTDYDINGLWDTTRYTDWQKTLIGGTAAYTNLYAGISGGSATTQFLVGATYNRQSTVFPGDFSDQKGGLHFSLTNNSPDQKFHFQLSGNYLVDDNLLPTTDFTGNAVQLAPDAPQLYNRNGSLNWEPDSSGASSWTNPLSRLYSKYTNKTDNLLANSVIGYEIVPGLEIKSNLGYTNLQSNEIQTYPSAINKPEQRAVNPDYAYYGNSTIKSWIVEPQITFKRDIGPGKMDLLVGSSIQHNNGQAQQLTGIGYSSDQVLEDIQAASNLSVLSVLNNVYKYSALFGRANYIWDGKYIMNATVRRDGSSRFGPANQFHDFGSFGLGWIFSQEGFLKNNARWLSFGKITGTYGTTGNDQIGDYKYLTLYSPISIQVPYQGVPSIAPSNLANPFLEWEQTKKIQVQLSLGFLQDRILLSSDYYINRSNNQLLPYTLPVITGFSSIIKNFPADVQNTGIELSLNTTNIRAKHVNWTSSFNLTIPSNKLLSFPNLSTSAYSTTLVIGQPITISKTFHYVGVDPASGLYQFAASHGGPTTNPQIGVDNNTIVNTAPKFYGGFKNAVQYKSLQLDFLIQFVKQVQPNYYFGLFPGTENISQPVSVFDRWQKPGDVKPIQVYNSNFSQYQSFANAAYYSDAHYSNASFVRLKNLSLSWNFPTQVVKKAHLQSCRLYVLGQNLITMTHYIGLDPETHNTVSIPPLKMFSMGIQAGL